MAVILRHLGNLYNVLFEELPDERTKSWFLAAKPYQVVTILGLYYMFVCNWGPRWMKKRAPYNLDKVLIVYNFLQVVTCMYVFKEALRVAWWKDYKWICEPVDRSNNPKSLAVAGVIYSYFLTKLFDLMDTIFFVLRKKNKQISFLHIYHHFGMVLLVWGALTYQPGGHGTLIGVINSFVHIVMYSYYLYSVAVPSAKNSLWWKKYITQLQILQFFLCVVHMSTIVFKPDCEYPRWTSAVFLPQNFFMLVLFIDFYIKAYIRKPAEEKEQKDVQTVKSKNSLENGSKTGYFVSRIDRKVE